ncbi:MAG: VWA domain-containing protein [Planctomycetes bacterium]|nr:VWA domain-containing protein [Planctomycetota bacterium]
MPRLRPILLLLLFLLCAPALAAAQKSDTLQRAQDFLKRLREHRLELDGDQFRELKLIVSDLRLLWAVDSTRERDVACALLDFVGLTIGNADLPSLEDDSGPALELRELCAEALRAHQDADFERFLARELLASGRTQPLLRRRAALWLVAPKPNPGLLLALLGCVRDPDPALRDLALESLCGYQDKGVNSLFLSLIEQPEAASGLPRAAELAERHFTRLPPQPLGPLGERLRALVEPGLRSQDWRAVSRAIAFSHPLEHAAIVPVLIDALEVWKKRAEAGLQALRVEHELVRALEDRAGRSYGFDVARWREWWSAVQRGEVAPPRTDNGADGRTRAGFFTLRPWTDRVVFVLDRSGSMSEGFGPTSPGGERRSRWDVAVGQLLRFAAELPAGARFDVVVFHDFAEIWKDDLVRADAESLRAAKLWLDQKPRGSTQLRAGVERVFGIAENRTLDLSRIDADTVIVLCDGATNEGPGWVPGFLSRVNARTRVLFDTVQIGAEGDGALERLAKGSGGEFVHIDG